jgi:hypothetical protein
MLRGGLISRRRITEYGRGDETLGIKFGDYTSCSRKASNCARIWFGSLEEVSCPC